MRWREGRRSSNIEDRRGSAPLVAGGGIGAVIIALLVYFLGGDPAAIQQGGQSTLDPAEESELYELTSAVLADTEDTWNAIFPAELGRSYREPKLVVFNGAVESGCGFAGAATGPFYCPLDEKIYIDLGFYRQLQEKFRAPGDFAQAYVIAHEVGHHVQNQLGIAEKVHAMRQRSSPERGNELSVRMELQADCLAGVWANHANRTRQLLEQGDVEEGLRAAAAIGDDTLQRRSQGYVVPESFTHGTSAQRVEWFRRGLERGDMRSCDTFS